jgi:hypothetical protein
MGGCQLVSSGSGHGPMAGSCEYGIELSVPQNLADILTRGATIGLVNIQ